MSLFQHKTRVLFVCKANICRSPMAEGLLRAQLAERRLQRGVKVDSAGTHASQPGRGADPRAQRVCAGEGIDLGRVRARQIRPKDFQAADYILAMDTKNLEWLVQACPDQHQHKLALIGSWAEDTALIDIPDPYYGNQAGFSRVFTLLRAAVAAFVVKDLLR